MFGAIGMPELVIVSVIALMVFGPAKFPDFGRSLGAALGGFKKVLNDIDELIFERSGSPTPLNHILRL
jgi:sec-independent protein translocase protein TatA